MAPDPLKLDPDLLLNQSMVTYYAVNGQEYKFDGIWFQSSIAHTYCYRGEKLADYTDPSPECMAISDYTWGFSSSVLYILLPLQLIWTLGMFFIWLDADIYSELYQKGRKMHGSFRNALDIAEAVKEVLGDEICAYLNKEIARQLDKSRARLRFYTISDADSGISHIGIGSNSSETGQKFRLHDNGLYGGGGLGRHQE